MTNLWLVRPKTQNASKAILGDNGRCVVRFNCEYLVHVESPPTLGTVRLTACGVNDIIRNLDLNSGSAVWPTRTSASPAHWPLSMSGIQGWYSASMAFWRSDTVSEISTQGSSPMVNRMKFYIDGAWVDPAVKKSTPVVNPATEEAMYEVAVGSKADVDKAVAAAQARLRDLLRRPAARSASRCWSKIIAAYKGRMKDIGAAISDEMGAPMPMAERAAGRRRPRPSQPPRWRCSRTTTSRRRSARPSSCASRSASSA